jgi:hypothetical protein
MSTTDDAGPGDDVAGFETGASELDIKNNLIWIDPGVLD